MSDEKMYGIFKPDGRLYEGGWDTEEAAGEFLLGCGIDPEKGYYIGQQCDHDNDIAKCQACKEGEAVAVDVEDYEEYDGFEEPVATGKGPLTPEEEEALKNWK